jgi:hypothetical protein
VRHPGSEGWLLLSAEFRLPAKALRHLKIYMALRFYNCQRPSWGAV